MADFTHFNEQGRAKMVDVGEKPETVRTAVAAGRVLVSPETFALIKSGGMKKGDVLTVAQVAGVMGAKRTPDVIPMCHLILIDGIDLSVKAGQHIALVGPSGGGKTTLASLIARFWDVTGGSIRIGGADVRNIPSDKLMQYVSYVFQDSKLLKMSILENVRMGRPGASDEEVMQALKDAQCMDIIEKFPDGVDTMMGSRGIYVSGGEAQRLSIARAFLKNAPILILDEATAFADPDNERLVQQAFEKLSKDKTVIMIAHRLSTVTNADRICVLADGKVAESGTHGELVSANGIYSRMWSEYNRSVSWQVGKAGV